MPFALGPNSVRLTDPLASDRYPENSFDNPELYNDLVFEYVDTNPFLENDLDTNTV